MRFPQWKWLLFILTIIIGSTACNSPQKAKLFTSLPASETGIDFVNALEYDSEFNVYTYRNFYNGGGVALGDVNNDGLIDIYFSGNMQDNKLYINQGNFRFEDVTEKAGVACKGVWSTGVSFADVNGDGWQDIYVCKSGNPQGEHRYNELFINNGDLTFTEKAEEYGIADKGFSTHAAFFDMDRDGDLDCYLLNNSFRAIGSFDLRKNQREERDPLGANKLYRNDDGKFVDISEEANIYGSAIVFGLGVTVGDVNRDGWQDIFVSNDFFERDYLYINNQDGTFTESAEQQMRELSAASMGADMADINNDGYPEIYVTDMLPEGDARLKTKTTFEDWDTYQRKVRTGYHHQFTRNVLHLNNGNNSFSEIGRMSGVSATDWSWGALIVDLDNDGKKDIYVANGIYQDLTDQDFINYIANPRTIHKVISRDDVDFAHLIDAIPSNRLPNYAFQNLGNLNFEDKAAEWGLGEPSHSNGAAYGDLDNDGDLDLVVNNVNMAPFVYRNEAETVRPDHHYLKFELKGAAQNPFALGAQITLTLDGEKIYYEQMPMRGFQSTMDHRPNLGLGTHDKVDSVVVRWPNDTYTVLTDVEADQTLKLSQQEGKASGIDANGSGSSQQIFTEVKMPEANSFKHQENPFVDFDRDRLIYHMLSNEGPKIAKGDVNGDGKEDIYVGGAKDQAGVLMLQTTRGEFNRVDMPAFAEDQASEDVDALFFDADNDQDLDLYVASGGNEYSRSASAIMDRLYLNDGQGNFSRSVPALASLRQESTACVRAADFDQDGDMDLFVGTRLIPFYYGVSPSSYLLENDGKGIFSEVSAKKAPALKEIGMITDASWVDYDGDGDQDLIAVGEWMGIRVLENEGAVLTDQSKALGLAKSDGFWNSLAVGDFDQDGDLDFVLANHGKNTRFKASEERPISMFVNDFDDNGTPEQIISVFNGDTAYPLALRHDLVRQMPILAKQYRKYADYQEQTIFDIFTDEQLKGSVKREVYHTESSLLINKGKEGFRLQALPLEAQLAPVYGLLVEDFDKDGKLDILLGGNQRRAKPEVGIYDASFGLLLKGKGDNNFVAVHPNASGFYVPGEIRDLVSVELGDSKVLLTALNDDYLRYFTY